MEDSFSVDEVPVDPFWDLQPPMQPQVGGDGGGEFTCDDAEDLSPSDWSFERFLEEELMDNSTPVDDTSGLVLQDDPVADAVEPATVAADAVGDPAEYNAMLKRKLEEDLAAIAMWKASGAMHPEIQGSNAYIGGYDYLAQNKFWDGGRLVQNADFFVNKLPASSSSLERSPSDDDDMDGEVAIRRIRKPDAEKVKKRKESNRESARRSRYRKAALIKDLEDQVAHLRVEKSSLLKRLGTINQKYKAATVDNRVLRADMETLRAKVKMAEDTVSRLLGTSSLHSNVVSGMPYLRNMPFVGSPSHATPDASVPIQDNIINYYTTAADAMVNNRYMPMPAQSSLQAVGGVSGSSNTRKINRIASHCTTPMELLQERVSAMPTSSRGIANMRRR